jgi:hypothetical protein
MNMASSVFVLASLLLHSIKQAFNNIMHQATSMNTKIESISLIMKDKAKALEFYTENAGFEKKMDVTNYG